MLFRSPLPINKVFSFIQEKDITGLLKLYGTEIQPGLCDLIKHFSAKVESEVELVTKPQKKKKSKRHAKTNAQREAVQKIAKKL